MLIDRCILGTVQLGIPYGIANTTGKPYQTVANALIHEAWQGGIMYFDTAKSYGQSEEVLGQALMACGACKDAHVITKLPVDLPQSEVALCAELTDSIQKLGVSRLHCVMLHREEQIPTLDGAVGNALANMQHTNIIEHIGISVYTPDSALAALRHPYISIIQVPTSIFDRRFIVAGIFDLACALGKKVHIRSVLLQGVLTLQPEQLSPCLTPLAPYIKEFHIVCATHAVSPACAALRWCLRSFADAAILFGAETAAQVRHNLLCIDENFDMPQELFDALNYLVPPQMETLLNPALWEK